MKILNKKTVGVYRTTCECGAELEVEEDDFKVGVFGLKYCICPCCGEEIEDDNFGGIVLNENNLTYPTHYFSFKGGLNISDEEINKTVKKGIIQLRKTNDKFWCSGSGNCLITILNHEEKGEDYEGEEDFEIIVSKDYSNVFVAK